VPPSNEYSNVVFGDTVALTVTDDAKPTHVPKVTPVTTGIPTTFTDVVIVDEQLLLPVNVKFTAWLPVVLKVIFVVEPVGDDADPFGMLHE
jgi:hypothetical protein